MGCQDPRVRAGPKLRVVGFCLSSTNLSAKDRRSDVVESAPPVRCFCDPLIQAHSVPRHQFELSEGRGGGGLAHGLAETCFVLIICAFG